MEKIKRYKNKPPLKGNALHELTVLVAVDLIVDNIIFDVNNLNLKDMEIRYLQEIEQGEKSLLYFLDENLTYQYDRNLKQWLPTEGGNR